MFHLIADYGQLAFARGLQADLARAGIVSTLRELPLTIGHTTGVYVAGDHYAQALLIARRSWMAA